jgi:hypothetical protein
MDSDQMADSPDGRANVPNESSSGPSTRSRLRRLGLRPPVGCADDKRPQSSEQVPQNSVAIADAYQERGRRSRRRVWKGLLFPVGLAVLGGAVGAIVAFVIAPAQQTRVNHGVEASQDADDAKSPAVLVENPQYDGGVDSASTARVLQPGDLDPYLGTPNLNISAQPLPPGDDVRIGEVVNPATTQGQPQVFERISFNLVGNHYKQVRVKSIRVRVVRRDEPPAGTMLFIGPQGGNAMESVGFNLDSTAPDARITTVSDLPSITNRPYFAERQITLDRFENVGVTATIFASKFRWQFFLDVVSDDGRVYTVSDNGKPWEISGFASKYSEIYAVDVSPPGPHVTKCDWPTDCLKRFE